MRIRARPSRGDVFLIRCSDAVGSEQNGIRPAVVIQNNRNNYSSSTTIIAMITSQEKKKMPVHVKLDNPNLKHNSCVLLEQVRTVSVDRLEKYICTLDESEMTRINRALKISLAV